MTASLLWGCGLLAFSPSAALTALFVGRRPEFVIIFIAGAFAWLVSMLLASVVWTVIPPLRDAWGLHVPVAVALQEAARYWLLRGYIQAETALKFSRGSGRPLLALRDVPSMVAAGTGFATMHALVMYGTVLASSTGSATLYIDGCEALPLLLLSGINEMLFVFINIALTVMALPAVRARDRVRVSGVFALHFVASMVTLINGVDNGCSISLPLLFIVTAVVLAATRQVMRTMD